MRIEGLLSDTGLCKQNIDSGGVKSIAIKELKPGLDQAFTWACVPQRRLHLSAVKLPFVSIGRLPNNCRPRYVEHLVPTHFQVTPASGSAFQLKSRMEEKTIDRDL